MEHVATPVNPISPPPDIPYLCGTYDDEGFHHLPGRTYDGKGFHQFPERMGWTAVSHGEHHYLLRGDDEEGNDEYEAAFIQAWLFIGLLAEILSTYGVPLRLSHVLDFRQNRLFVSTALLPQYLDMMAAMDQSRSIEERKSRMTEAMLIFNKAANFAKCLASAGDMHAVCLPPEVALSILVLGATLQGAVLYMSRDFFQMSIDEDVPEDVRSALTGFEKLTSAFTRKKLTEAQWCKSDINLLARGLHVENLYYASLLDRKGMAIGHSVCTEDQCFASTVDEQTYETKHVEVGCICPHVTADTSRITLMLRNGMIPAMVYHPPSSGRGDNQSGWIEVVDSASQPYVAISHVWSDGLGNTRANSLPQCQLQRLRNLVSQLPPAITAAEPSHFDSIQAVQRPSASGSSAHYAPIWIDTLCVPLEREARKLALTMMKETYRRACTVLVLDGELQQATANCDWKEICIRIGMSMWSRRLWPLQEAALAQRQLCFQFAERSIDFNYPISEVRSPHILRYRQELQIRGYLHRSVPPFNAQQVDLTELVYLCQSLLYRTTSKAADETFCIASLLGLDVATLLSYPSPERRMQEFFTLLQKIPSSILFLDAAKLPSAGFRWAPKTLLTQQSNLANFWRGEASTPVAHCDGSRLQVQLPGYTIRVEKPIKDNSIWVRDVDGGNVLFLLYRTTEQPWNEERWNEVREARDLALVTQSTALPTLGFLASIDSADQNKGGGQSLPTSSVVVTYLCAVQITGLKEIINWEAVTGAYCSAQCVRKLPPEQEWWIR
jgi:Heterokaryon incompatibility protein (HET)